MISYLNDAFLSVMREFIPDFLSEFPSYANTLHPGINAIIEYTDSKFPESVREDVIKVYNFSKLYLPRHFVDIINNDMNFLLSESPNVTTELIIGIDFKNIWKDQSTSDNTKSVIMNYLQMFLLSLISDIQDKSTFGDTNVFENMDDESFQEKLNDMVENFDEYFKDKENVPNIPKPEEINEKMNSLLNGKIGELAKEIANEALDDLKSEVPLDTINPDVLKKILNDPSKIMKITNRIGTKLDEKIKNGDLTDKELLQEASSIMETFTNIPGMELMQDMVFNMFTPKQQEQKNKMKQAMNAANTKERMLQKLKQRQESSKSSIVGEKKEQIFRTENSESIQKSARPKNKNKNKNKNKKKKKN